ncbi:MAG TPA: outer-membrane lipoprotein carrier protein LolA [Hyphomicrobiaceae bacterium]|nr:outer-membrane lipoprotein carrier protein LolA [Hyphomicrobiaceae bacterium]
MIGLERWAGGRGIRRLTAILALAMLASSAAAQDSKQKPSNPIGGWGNAKVTNEPAVTGLALDPKQVEIVKSVSNYFNELINLRGNFVQTNAENQRLRGKFFVKRPGRLRFEYALPSKQLIVSDGNMLAIQDLDINTDDRLALEQTTFRILLRKDVDLLRDARVLEVQEADDLVIVALQDKNPEASGRIRLFLTKTPALELKEWVTTDAQGLDTRIEISNLNKTEDIDPGLFKIVSPALNKPQ